MNVKKGTQNARRRVFRPSTIGMFLTTNKLYCSYFHDDESGEEEDVGRSGPAYCVDGGWRREKIRTTLMYLALQETGYTPAISYALCRDFYSPLALQQVKLACTWR